MKRKGREGINIPLRHKTRLKREQIGKNGTITNKLQKKMKQNEVKRANALNVCENVRELNTKSQTLVSIKNVFRFMAVCAGAGLLVFGGAYELAENGVDIVGQWFYTD